MKAVTGKAMAELDHKAQEEAGIPGLLLMENAGQKAWRLFASRIKKDVGSATKLCFVSGKGNNGGDALVMARAALCDGCSGLTVVLLSGEANDSVLLHTSICRGYGIDVLYASEDFGAVQKAVREADVLFDGLAGTGLHGPLRGDAKALVSEMNLSNALKIAVDVPSGVGDQSTFSSGSVVFLADYTLCMELVKIALLSPQGRSCAGTIICVPLGFPPDMIIETPAAAHYFLPEDIKPPQVDPWAYKNSRGHLLVSGGAAGTEGAPFLSALSALKAGAGLVTLLVDQNIADKNGVEQSGLMVHASDFGSSDFYKKDLSFADVLVMGPGWGKDDERIRAFDHFVEKTPGGVIDADAIALLSRWIDPGKRLLPGKEKSKNRIGWIITPHPGEATALVLALTEAGITFSALDKNGKSSKEEKASFIRQLLLARPWDLLPELSRHINGVVMLKSHMVHIASPEGGYHILEGNNPALGTAGSGDALAGICGAMLLHRELSAEEAALQAAALHQRTGRRARERYGYFSAAELIGEIGLESLY
jgi:ADP-dependent NAD(P)H-hydrate dehydratase / NAD(P)H-hydrate epimerase